MFSSRPRLAYASHCSWIPFVFMFGWTSSFTVGRAQDDVKNEVRFVAKEPSTAAAVYGQTVRETEPRSATEELAGFHVPDGFRVELIASEPAIAKPMNLAFDERGRLWVTQSSNYPYPSASGSDRLDAVVTFEDRDRDGRFESSRVFADQLNIPIGILPFGDGALCFSIPNILYLRDTDGDGVCDRRDVVLGPFDTTRDTHGMINSMRMGTDGWVYACHGFNNQSEVAGNDGHTIKMTSGNVFRFRPDGSRVELYTQGQVNPFGMAQDRFGFWYAADCHSKPISQLIRGGCYPSFGRPDDGLGFVPSMMDHLHGSTAIAGLAHTKDSRFPMAMQDNFLSGNVMTCRINRNRIDYQGSTAKGIEMPDLLTSDDAWFRPVDLQFGPDGHLYVADFYNKVIGHYEVPLDHPGRDRRRGRIWRVRWEGGDALRPTMRSSNLQDRSMTSLDRLASINSQELHRTLLSIAATLSQPSKAEGLNTTDVERLIAFASGLDLKADSSAKNLQTIVDIISSPQDATIEQRASWILQQADRIDEKHDPVLAQSIRIGLRRVLQEFVHIDPNRLSEWLEDATVQPSPGSLRKPSSKSLVQVLLAMKQLTASRGLLRILEKVALSSEATEEDRQTTQEYVLRMSDVIEAADAERFIALVESTANDANVFADHLLRIATRQKQQAGQISNPIQQRGQSITLQVARDWLQQSEAKLRDDARQAFIAWKGTSSGKAEDRRDWGLEKRQATKPLQSAKTTLELLSSFTLGETYVGTWATSPFASPEKLTFYLAGHNGLPKQEGHKKNYVQLVRLDSAGNERDEIARAYPPRNDVATMVEWDLKQHRGETVVFRVVDGDSAASYAWLAVGQYSYDGLNQNPLRKQWERMVGLASVFGWPVQHEADSVWESLLRSKQADWACRFQLSRCREHAQVASLVGLIEFASEKNWLDLIQAFGNGFPDAKAWNWTTYAEAEQTAFAESVVRRCSYKDQERLVSRLSKHRDAGVLFAKLIGKGALSRESLRALPNSYWESIASNLNHPLAGMKPESQTPSARLAVVESKSSAAESLQVDLAIGEKHFVDRCAVCHKLGQVGKVIGPQLEGIGARGIERLCEDILWPDRNVDEAFRMTLLVLDGGETVNGLVSDRNAESLLLTDQLGKQRRILVSEIEQEKPSKLSLMPGNFEETMSTQDLASLIGYLRHTAGVTKR